MKSVFGGRSGCVIEAGMALLVSGVTTAVAEPSISSDKIRRIHHIISQE